MRLRLSVVWNCFSSHFSFLVLLFSWTWCYLYCFYCCNERFFCLINVVYETSYQCIDAMFNAGEFSSSFFSWKIQPVYWMEFFSCLLDGVLLLSIGWSSSLVHFKNYPAYLTRGTGQVFIPLMRFLLYRFASKSFLVNLRDSFLFLFFHHHLFDSVHFHYSQVLVIFLWDFRFF